MSNKPKFLKMITDRYELREEDIKLLQELYDEYIKNVGMEYGFLRWLVEPRKADKERGEFKEFKPWLKSS